MEKSSITTTNSSNELIKSLSHYWYVPLLLIPILAFFKSFILIVIILFMAVSAFAISFYRYFIPFHLGVELITFYSLILTVAVGPFTGIIFALSMLIITDTLHGKLHAFIFVKLGTYLLLCIIVFFIGKENLIDSIWVVAILRNVIYILGTCLFNPMLVIMDLPGLVINVFLNVWLFTSFGNGLINLLS